MATRFIQMSQKLKRGGLEEASIERKVMTKVLSSNYE